MQTLSKYLLVSWIGVFCGVLSAQTLEVSKSPVSVDTEYLESGTAFEHAMLAVRFECTGGDVDLDGFALKPSGATFDTDVIEIACWLDDGDGLFDPQLDTQLWSGAPVLPKTTVSFAAPLTITDATFEDIWVVAFFDAGAGSSEGKSYLMELGDTSDVSAGGAGVVLGTPLPASSPVILVAFEILSTSFVFNLEIQGSGFTPPFELTVDGETYYYPAPAGPPWRSWSPYGMAYSGDGYVLLEDHSAVRFIARERNGVWRYWSDVLQVGTPVSVQLTTASTGSHNLGIMTYEDYSSSNYYYYSYDDGYYDEGCAATGTGGGLPVGLALLILALAAKSLLVAIHMNHADDHLPRRG